MKKLGFIGGGNMAEALAHGLIQHKVFKPAEIIVSDVAPERRRKLARALKVATTDDNAEVVREAGAVLLAVKPQTIDAVMAGTRGRIGENGRKSGRQRQAVHFDCRRRDDCAADPRARDARASDPRDAERARDGGSWDGGDGACARSVGGR